MQEYLLRRLVRIPGFFRLWRKLGLGSVALRTEFGALERPHYAFGVLSAAQQALRLGLSKIAVIEMGVAGGTGLLALEAIAREVADHSGVEVTVYGFDSGAGMPVTKDFRDLPHVWGQGFFAMDQDALRQRLTSAQLILGDVRETAPRFVGAPGREPIGFVAFDLDYYSSTKAAFALFEGPPSTRLPRVYCYMDDIIWPPWACHNEFVGELAAIREYNEAHDTRKIVPLHLLRHMRLIPEAWNDQIYIHHDFSHPLYTSRQTPAIESETQLPLRS